MSTMPLPSILDNDFYKFTMQHAVIKLFPYAKARYEFINRGKHVFPTGFDVALRNALESMRHLKMNAEEKAFLRVTCPYLDATYLDFLEGYRYNPDEVVITQNGSDLSVKIEGMWYRTILWEVPIMSLICELFYQLTNQVPDSDEIIAQKALNKMKLYNEWGVNIAEFGTRRRHSFHTQELVVKTLSEKGAPGFVGTSNVYLAMKHQTKPIGTHAHEWFMFHAAKYGFKMANRMGLDSWVDVYRGDLGIALTDTYTTDVFLKQFDKKLAKLFDGVRHDSGDPIEFADKIISRYQELGIDPRLKSIIFSDGLNSDKVKRIAEYCKGKIGLSFGIGTDFTNDVGLKPMNIVLKMVEALPQDEDWTGVVKLSDEPMKHTGTDRNIRLAKEVLNLE